MTSVDIDNVDFLVVGAGIFGAYAALYLSAQGYRVLLLEREDVPFQKSSVVNQARLHSGYHYPRSIATARMAHGYRERFLHDHAAFVNASFTHYYGIDRYSSLTNAAQFERFCEKIGADLTPARRDDVFLNDRLEGLFVATEHSFDPFLIRNHYTARLQAAEIPCTFGWCAVEAQADGAAWQVVLAGPDGARRQIRAGGVINAAYANLNAVNSVFGIAPLDVTHELSEVVLLSVAELAGCGLTVMDGPFMSIMPFGLSGLHSLTSVLYTHQTFSSGHHPAFDCQSRRPDCTPQAVRVCTTCFARPETNARKMERQMRNYVSADVGAHIHGSLYTVKTKLKRSFIDDSRPTEISVLRQTPMFACVFSGKINSIYEIEGLMAHV